jgi:hypothetical protein
VRRMWAWAMAKARRHRCIWNRGACDFRALLHLLYFLRKVSSHFQLNYRSALQSSSIQQIRVSENIERCSLRLYYLKKRYSVFYCDCSSLTRVNFGKLELGTPLLTTTNSGLSFKIIPTI